MNRILTGFRYMKPYLEQHLLQDNESYMSIDAEVHSGGLQAFRSNVFEAHVPPSFATHKPQSFYRYTDDNRRQWLYFNSKTDVVRSPVTDDVGNACYITGADSFPRVFTTDTLPDTAITIDGTNSYKAGLPKPATPNLGTVASGNNGAPSPRSNTYRIAYARVWDTHWDAASGAQPSRRVDIGGMSNATGIVNVNSSTCAHITGTMPADDGSHMRMVVIYRNATGSSSSDWREVTRLNVAPGANWAFIDAVSDVNLGAIATNEDASVPDGLTGIVSLHNGVIAGFVGNTVYCSVPYYFVFPRSQTVVTDFEIVGMGSFQNTLVICTKGNTYLCVCHDPTNMLITPVQEAQTCVAKDSIVSLRDSVVFASPYGLIKVTGNGSEQITENIIGHFRWGYYNPPSIRAAAYNGNYLFYFDSNVLPYSGAIINIGNPEIGLLGLSAAPFAIWHDDVSTDVFIIINSPLLGTLNVYGFGKSYSVGRIYTWVSKKFLRNDGLVSPAAVKLNFLPEYTLIEIPKFIYEYSQAALNIPTVNTFCLNGDANTWDSNMIKYGSSQCQLTIYGDDEEWDKMNISSKDFYRVKGGRRFDSYFVKITSTVPIMKVQLATSAGELE